MGLERGCFALEQMRTNLKNYIAYVQAVDERKEIYKITGVMYIINCNIYCNKNNSYRL